MESLGRPESRGIDRRTAFRLAAGWGLSWAWPGLADEGGSRPGAGRKKSLITLWLAGGPSQLETWDPHPGSPIGGSTREISTSLAGVKIGADYPQVAEQLAHYSVIRSLVSKEGDHERGSYVLHTGYRPDTTLKHPVLGSILAQQIPDSRLQIPPHIAIGPANFRPRGGFLGDEFDAFQVYDPRQNLTNMKMWVSETRKGRRLSGLEVAEAAFRKDREAEVRSTLHRETLERALAMMNSAQLRAFQIDEEPVAVRRAYGETIFGAGCLAARRLVEQGVRAVEVELGGWDSHVDNFQIHSQNARSLDPALAMLTRDLRERGLWETTVVLVLGEFGRTPTINKLDGRDHWPQGFSCLVGGGGMASGVLIGETDPTGRATAPKDPVEIPALSATVLAALGVDPAKELTTPIGRPMALSEGQPLSRLWSGASTKRRG